jgi:myo-inositol 2-dehydrogenase / D-chiro-inositol 1-dehydrogenase
MAQIRVGLIGLGEVAQLMHLPLLADDPRFEIAAVTDVSPSLSAAMARRYAVPQVHGSAEALIGDEALDLIFILTPDHLHAPLLSAAIRTGRHVFVEKPVTLTEAELAPVRALSRAPGQVVFVGYMRRYSRPFLELRRRRPELSEIRHVRVRDVIREAPFFVAQTRRIVRPDDVPAALVAEGKAQADAARKSVMGDCSTDALRAHAVLTGLSSHSFSAMRELLGPPRGCPWAVEHGGETVLAAFDYGSFTALYEAVIDDVSRFEAGIEITTQTQHFRLTYDTPYVRNLPTRLEITTSTETDTGTEIFGPVYEDPFRLQLDALHDAVVHGAPVKTSLEDAALDLKLFAEVARHFRK